MEFTRPSHVGVIILGTMEKSLAIWRRECSSIISGLRTKADNKYFLNSSQTIHLLNNQRMETNVLRYDNTESCSMQYWGLRKC